MRRLYLLTLLTAVLFTARPLALRAASPQIFPVPQKVTLLTGEVDLRAGVTLRLPADRALRREVEGFARRMLAEEQVAVLRAGVPLRLDLDTTLPAEGYRLTLRPEGITLQGGTTAGLYYGMVTLQQLVADHAGRLPAMEVVDAPHFAYRGALLDCCRHFFTVAEVKRFIDLLAMHKMNRFHWHLTDDQGWRIEIKRYPELVRIGSYRPETIVGFEDSGIFDGTPHSGYYSQREIHDIVAYAAACYITVIPEIDMPGHAMAALASYPMLGCRGAGYRVPTYWDIFDDVYCPGKESTFTWLQGVLEEVLTLFPSTYIHLGGDECSKKRWVECPHCRARMEAEGLTDAPQLQRYFMGRMERWLAERGRRMIGWDEILEGGVSPSATVMSWRGSQGGIAAAKSGNKVIMSPNDYCYLDYYQTRRKQEIEPLAIGGCVPLRKCYALDPYAELSEAEQRYIIGVQGNVWTEYIATYDRVEEMTLPRLAALAEVGWGYPRRDFEGFTRRLEMMRRRYDRLGLHYAPYFFDGTDE